MTLRERLRLWAAIRGVRPDAEGGDVAGGREAERLLAGLVGSSSEFRGATLLPARRIPEPGGGRRREIDLIVCTPRAVHLIEVKGWSGRVTLEGGSWRQERRSGEVVDHGDLLRDNERRRLAVAEYLRAGGVPVDAAFERARLLPEIMFTNPRLELDPAVEARPDVYSRRELDALLATGARRGAAGRLVAALLETCLGREAGRRGAAALDPLPGPTVSAIVDRLGRAPTWDRLHLHGGRVVAGDLIRLRLGGVEYRRPDLDARAPGGVVRLRWSRGRLVGLLKALTGLRRLGSARLVDGPVELLADDEALFHAAGDLAPAARRLIAVDQITLG